MIATDGCGPALCASRLRGYVYGGHAFAFCEGPYTRDEAVARCTSMGMRSGPDRRRRAEQLGLLRWPIVVGPIGPIWIGAAI